MPKTIKLTHGQFATVCDCCAHKVEGKKWSANFFKKLGGYYAVRNATMAERLSGSPATILMHVVINGTPKGLLTDHINHDTLDNRCENLRTATKTQNSQNRGKQKNNTTGYKGVFCVKGRRNRWLAKLVVNGKQTYAGYHSTPEAAARAYEEAARKHFGAFSVSNHKE